jgi:hypothetical protein
MAIKYRIQLVESERGWGREYWQETYDTFEEAQQRIRSVNEKNTSMTVPDWYMIAETGIEAVEVVE